VTRFKEHNERKLAARGPAGVVRGFQGCVLALDELARSHKATYVELADAPRKASELRDEFVVWFTHPERIQITKLTYSKASWTPKGWRPTIKWGPLASRGVK